MNFSWEDDRLFFGDLLCKQLPIRGLASLTDRAFFGSWRMHLPSPCRSATVHCQKTGTVIGRAP